MADQVLTEEIGATLGALDQLVMQHQQAEMYDRQREQLAFIHGILCDLQAELRALRLVVAAQKVAGDPEAADEPRYHALCTIRSRAPEGLQSPGRAIAQGGIDLLRLVEFASAAREIAHERRLHLGRQFAHYLPQQDPQRLGPIGREILSQLSHSSAATIFEGSANELLDLLGKLMSIEDPSLQQS